MCIFGCRLVRLRQTPHGKPTRCAGKSVNVWRRDSVVSRHPEWDQAFSDRQIFTDDATNFHRGRSMCSEWSRVAKFRLKPITNLDQLRAFRLADWDKYRNINPNPRPAGCTCQVLINPDAKPLVRCALYCFFGQSMVDTCVFSGLVPFGASGAPFLDRNLSLA